MCMCILFKYQYWAKLVIIKTKQHESIKKKKFKNSFDNQSTNNKF